MIDFAKPDPLSDPVMPMMVGLCLVDEHGGLGPVFWPEDPSITGPQRWLHPARPAPVAATAPTAAVTAHLRGLARSASVALPASWQAHAVFARFGRYRQDDDAGDDPPPVGRWLVAWTVPEGPVVGLWTVDPLTGAARIVLPAPAATGAPGR